MTPKILITTTTNYPLAARLVGGLAAVGCAVDALSPGRHPLRKSRYLSNHLSYHALTAQSRLRTAIEQSKPDLIVPCDDRAVLQLLVLYKNVLQESVATPQLLELIRRSFGCPENYGSMMSRSSFIDRANRLGIPAPEATTLRTEADLISVLEDWGFPVVLKRDHSWGGTGVRIVKTPEEAVSTFRRWSSPPTKARALATAIRFRDPHFLPSLFRTILPATVSSQRFVSGHPATTAFASWNGRVLASVHMDVLATEREMGPSCVVKQVQSPQMSDIAEKIARHYGLSGLHGLDYIKDAAGDVHLLEINPRATGVCYLPLGDRGDLLASLVSCISEAPVPARRPAVLKDVIALYPQEVVRDPASHYLNTAYHDVPHDDPALMNSLARSARWALARKFVRKIFNSAPTASAKTDDAYVGKVR